MANKTYSEKLKHPKWQRRRLEIMSRDNFTCKICGDTETPFNVHHLSYSGEPWDAPEEQLITLCVDCHHIVSVAKIKILPTTRALKMGTRYVGIFFFTGEVLLQYIKDNGTILPGTHFHYKSLVKLSDFLLSVKNEALDV